MKSHSLPTVDSRQNFYLGGIYALVLTALIVMIFYRILQGLDDIHSFAIEKNNAVTVSLISVPLPRSRQASTPKPVFVPKVKSTKTAQESKPVVEDIASLFSDVTTQKIVHTKRPKPSEDIDLSRMASLTKRTKTSLKRAPSATAQQVKALKLVRPLQHGSSAATSGGKEVDKYYARIQAIIYENFYPPVNSEGLVASIRIWISASGHLTRSKVLQRSGESFFDQEVSALQQRLEAIAFGANPSGKTTVLDVKLISKE